MIHPDVFFGRLLGPLMKVCLPLMKNVPRPLATALAKSVLIPLEETVSSAADAQIHAEILGCEI